MDDLKLITASNIINLRTAAKMTQAELAEKLSYSDKSVSKWERAEAVPDAYILKAMSEIFGVTVDWLLTPHDEWKPPAAKKPENKMRNRVITNIVIVGILMLALLVFIVFWILGDFIWLVFVYAVPVALITLLVLHSIWEEGRYNYWLVGALVFSLVAVIYFSSYMFGRYNWWQIFLLLVPAELIVFLCSRLKARRQKTEK